MSEWRFLEWALAVYLTGFAVTFVWLMTMYIVDYVNWDKQELEEPDEDICWTAGVFGLEQPPQKPELSSYFGMAIGVCFFCSTFWFAMLKDFMERK